MFVIAVDRANEGRRVFLKPEPASCGAEFYTEDLIAAEMFPTAHDAVRRLNGLVIDRPMYARGRANGPWRLLAGLSTSKPTEQFQIHVLEVQLRTLMSIHDLKIRLEE